MIQINIEDPSIELGCLININEFESIFSLKFKLMDKINWDDKYLLYAGKILDDKRSLLSYSIKDGSTVYVQQKLNGGNLLKIKNLMIVALVILIMTFFMYLVTGFLPVFANIFYFLVKMTVDKLIGLGKWILSLIREEQASISNITLQKGAFSLEKAKTQFQKQTEKKIEQKGEERAKSYNFLNILYDAFFFFLKLGFTFIFIFTSSAGLILPLFWFRTDGDTCKSLNLAYYVGLVITVIYFIFYGLFLNTVDTLVNAYFFASSLLPTFLKAFPDMLLSAIKNSFDEAKLGPFYAIPILGQILLVYHQGIESIVLMLKSVLDYQSLYDCDGGRKEDNIKRMVKDINSNYVQGTLSYQGMIKTLKTYIKQFKMEGFFKLLNISFNEQYERNNPYTKAMEEPWYQRIFNKDFWNLYVSSSARWLICSLLGFGIATDKFIDEMNGPLGVANMIKTGNIAGVFTALAYFIIIILALLLSSMFGISIKK